MSIIRQIAEAIHREIAGICRTFGFESEVARNMLRIEVNYDTVSAIHFEYRPDNPYLAWPRFDGSKETAISGVSLYIVEHEIPAPGWRTINPTAKLRHHVCRTSGPIPYEAD